jgi:hypothetical protein
MNPLLPLFVAFGSWLAIYLVTGKPKPKKRARKELKNYVKPCKIIEMNCRRELLTQVNEN